MSEIEITDEMVETAARAIVEDNGDDPDELCESGHDHPAMSRLWRQYTGAAKAALAAVAPLISAAAIEAERTACAKAAAAVANTVKDVTTQYRLGAGTAAEAIRARSR